MICKPCAAAADRRADRDQHCDDTGCTCGHKVERYGTATNAAAPERPAGDPR